MKQFLDYDGLGKYTSLLNTRFAQLENGKVKSSQIPLSSKDVVEFDGFTNAGIITENQNPLFGIYDVVYFSNEKCFVAVEKNTINHYTNFDQFDMYQQKVSNVTIPYSNKIYVDRSSDNSVLYRWNGTDLVKISDTSNISWDNITDKPNVVLDITQQSSATKLIHTISYANSPIDKLINIPIADSDKAGIITAETSDFIDSLKQFNLLFYAESVSRYGIINPSNINANITAESIAINIPYDTIGDGAQSNTKTITLPAATENASGVFTAKNRRLFGIYIGNGHDNILYSNISYNTDNVVVGQTITYNPETTTGVVHRPTYKQHVINPATPTTAGVMSSEDKQKLESLYNKQSTILISEYVESGILTQASLIAQVIVNVVYLANLNVLAAKHEGAYYRNWSNAWQYGDLDESGNWVPKQECFYITTSDFKMYLYHKNKLNKIN